MNATLWVENNDTLLGKGITNSATKERLTVVSVSETGKSRRRVIAPNWSHGGRVAFERCVAVEAR